MNKKMLIVNAINALHPDFVLGYIDKTPEFNYNNLTFEKGSFAQLDMDAVEAKVTELISAEPMKALRRQRTFLLSQTDWVAARAAEGLEISAEWKTYRQALRDLPATAEPQLDENGMLTNVTWPEKPE